MFIREWLQRIKQGYQTSAFPFIEPNLPPKFKGVPEISKGECPPHCSLCEQVCPTDAILLNPLKINLAKCIFCGECEKICPENRMTFQTGHYQMATSDKEKLILERDKLFAPFWQMEKDIKRIFGRSLKIRQVSAGSCNACDLDTQVLQTTGFDIGRFGIQWVASPRHADLLLVTGAVTKTMSEALINCYEAMPKPSFVIAVGTCALSGGLFASSPQQLGGVDRVLPVDLYIPGCPPSPWTVLDGLLRLIGRRASVKKGDL